MTRYYVACEPDLGFYPNYSFEVGDVTGDGQQELVALSTDGNILRILKLDGSLLLERRLHNYGTWGTIVLTLADVDHDGRREIIVPDGPPGDAHVIALNADNEVIREVHLENSAGDDYGVAVPLLGRFRRDLDGRIGISVGVAGGRLVALDTHFRILWTYSHLRHDFGHDFFNCDIDGDGVDEIIFLTVDRINHTGPEIEGELVILRADSRPYLRKAVRDVYPDTHFDDVVIADFRGIGRKEILVEKGILMNIQGEIVWDLSDEFRHGQWIATAPNPHGPGLLIFISELWSTEGKSKMLDPSGKVLWELGRDRHTRLHPEQVPGYQVLPTRAHAVDWFNNGHEIVLGEQIEGPTGHACYEEMSHDLKLFFFDLEGHLLHEMPFRDTRHCGFWYNGEVRSHIADMDGDGYPEWVFPRQDGRVMIIKKERTAST